MAKCPNCGKQNKVTAKFCEGCGTTLNDTATSAPNGSESTSGGPMGWWNKQSTKGKAAVGIVGICCLGLILIVGIGGLLSPDNTNATPQSSTATSAVTTKTVTISQLYGSSVAKGTTVKVTGKVFQSDGSNLLIENSNGQDVLVQGDDVEAYEGKSVTVTGTFDGPTSYTTVLGSERTVPTITDAQIVS